MEKKIIRVKPTNPGFLLITYSDSSEKLVEIKNAPDSEEINDISPTLHGVSENICPHCQAKLIDYYNYVYFSKIVKDRVYSFDQNEWEEIIVNRYCEYCKVDIFEWEMTELYLDYIESLTGNGGLDGVFRLEPVTNSPGNCPGHRKVACNGISDEMKCAGYPECLKTMECKEDWHIMVKGSKISLINMHKPGNIKKILKVFKNKYDV
jgi:hypothetical protein